MAFSDCYFVQIKFRLNFSKIKEKKFMKKKPRKFKMFILSSLDLKRD